MTGYTLIILDEHLSIDGSNKLVKIRLLMVDTPEVHNVTFPEPFGPEASAYAKEILTNQKVRLEFDKEKLDPYGRTLAYIYLEDGRMFNEMLNVIGTRTC
ncbi:thermonuclease family protein [Sutcliffiella cohnii]